MAPSATLTPARLATAVRRRRPLRIALGVLAVILGLGGMALGGLLFTGAHNSHPVEVDGTIADYQAITINGSYAHNDLRLAGDAHTYTFDSHQFHPALPERFQKDARIQIWVDQGTTNVLAITLYDELGLNPTAYTTNAYDNPTLAFYGSLTEAGVLAGLGVVLLLGGGVLALGRGKRRSRKRGHEQGASQHEPRGATPAPASAPAGAGQRVPAVALPAAIPTAQAVPTTPMPGRQPAPPRPAMPAAGIDQIPTQKAPAVAPITPPGMPPAAPAQPGGLAISGDVNQWGAWGAPPQPASPLPFPPLAPPGSLPDFPTERMPSAPPLPPTAGNPLGDVGDQPTRKSETAPPPDPSRGG